MHHLTGAEICSEVTRFCHVSLGNELQLLAYPLSSSIREGSFCTFVDNMMALSESHATDVNAIYNPNGLLIL